MVLRIFDCDLCIVIALDLLAHPHSSIPYPDHFCFGILPPTALLLTSKDDCLIAIDCAR